MDRYISGVSTLELNQANCIGCAMCTIVCPHNVFILVEQLNGDLKVEIRDIDACMECGACARNCPAEAIDVRAGVGCASGVLFSSKGQSADCCS